MKEIGSFVRQIVARATSLAATSDRGTPELTDAARQRCIGKDWLDAELRNGAVLIGKVQAGEFSEILLGKAIVRPRSLFRGVEPELLDATALDGNERAVFIVAPVDALEGISAATAFVAVASILRDRAKSQVPPRVIETVHVGVVDRLAIASNHDDAMEPYFLRPPRLRLIPNQIGAAIIYEHNPIVGGEQRIVLLVYLSAITAREHKMDRHAVPPQRGAAAEATVPSLSEKTSKKAADDAPCLGDGRRSLATPAMERLVATLDAADRATRATTGGGHPPSRGLDVVTGTP